METICPVGHFCPQGSEFPDPCLTGTYTNTEGLEASDNCTACDPGKFCNDTGRIMSKFFFIKFMKKHIKKTSQENDQHFRPVV